MREYALEIDRGIQNPAKHLKCSKKERLTKTNYGLELFQILVTLNKLLFPGILFLRIIFSFITFPIIQIIFLRFDP